MIKIAPSLLAADLCHLANQIRDLEKAGADWLHIDIMDGHYVPNITYGPHFIQAVRKCSRLPLDVHLMIENPEDFVNTFRKAGADIITVHQETCPHLYSIIKMIKDCGAMAGVSINPSTPVETLKEVISDLNLILIMTVEPGFGGQKFINSTLKKIKTAKEMIKETGKNIYLEVDGGIDFETATEVLKAGANVLVAGTSIFNSNSVKSAIAKFRNLSNQIEV